MSVALALVVAATVATPAHADGGVDIASAPVVTIGAQQFGNTANGSAVSNNCDARYNQFWLLPVTAGDQVTIDWGVFSPDHSSTKLLVYPVGTTDFTVFSASTVKETFYLSANQKASSVFTAAQSGNLPLRFGGYGSCNVQNAGPYAFTATIVRNLLVTLEQRTSVPSKGSLGVSANTPVGTPVTSGATVTLQVAGKGLPWTDIGSSPVTGPTTTVQYAMPAVLNGAKVKIRAMVSGPGYAGSVSAPQTTLIGTPQSLTLSVADRTVKRLDKARLSGVATGLPAGTRVKIFQRLVGGTRWALEGTTYVKVGQRFSYSEVVHRGDRYYRACVKSVCSAAKLVRIV